MMIANQGKTRYRTRNGDRSRDIPRVVQVCPDSSTMALPLERSRSHFIKSIWVHENKAPNSRLRFFNLSVLNHYDPITSRHFRFSYRSKSSTYPILVSKFPLRDYSAPNKCPGNSRWGRNLDQSQHIDERSLFIYSIQFNSFQSNSNQLDEREK